MIHDIRWKQRYLDYSSMVNTLRRGIEGKSLHELSEFEQMGLVKSFELSFELLWKLMKDYMQDSDVDFKKLAEEGHEAK